MNLSLSPSQKYRHNRWKDQLIGLYSSMIYLKWQHKEKRWKEIIWKFIWNECVFVLPTGILSYWYLCPCVILSHKCEQGPWFASTTNRFWQSWRDVLPFLLESFISLLALRKQSGILKNPMWSGNIDTF